MSEQQISGESGEHADPGMPDVSPTAEQGSPDALEGTDDGGQTGEIGRVDESDSTGGGPVIDEVTEGEQTAALDVADGDERDTRTADEIEEDERPSSHAPDPHPDEEEKARRAENRIPKPTWDVRTHGPLADDDDRRQRYEVVGEPDTED